MAWTSPRTWVVAEMVTAALLNAHVRDNLKEFEVEIAGPGGWIVPTLSGWSHFATNPVRWKKIGGWIQVLGQVSHATGGPTAAAIFTLPVGARPDFEHIIARQGNRSSPSGLPWADIRYAADGSVLTHTPSLINLYLAYSFWVGA